MTIQTALRLSAVTVLVAGLAACGTSSGNVFGSGSQSRQTQSSNLGQPERWDTLDTAAADRIDVINQNEPTIWDLFSNNQNPNSTVAVNKYLWNASLDVLNFLPIQSVDPFTGIIVTGYGTPPGGGRSYRATIKISDPALDARSLKLSLQGAGGSAVAPDTVRAVEDAILTRARQLRIRDGEL